jgi:hypothetical protein
MPVAADLRACPHRRVPRLLRAVQTDRPVRSSPGRQRVRLVDRVRLQRVLGELQPVAVHARAAVPGATPRCHPPLATSRTTSRPGRGSSSVTGQFTPSGSVCSGSSKVIAVPSADSSADSSNARARTGSSSALPAGSRPRPAAESGWGQIHGQYAEETASRMRWPGGKAWPMPFSSNVTSSAAPGSQGTARSPPWRADRLSTPRVTRVEDSSGATSQSRATTSRAAPQTSAAAAPSAAPAPRPPRPLRKRSVSWREPIAGPGGRPRSGYWCDQGPIRPWTRSTGRCSTRRRTVSRYGSCRPPTARTAASIVP